MAHYCAIDTIYSTGILRTATTKVTFSFICLYFDIWYFGTFTHLKNCPPRSFSQSNVLLGEAKSRSESYTVAKAHMVPNKTKSDKKKNDARKKIKHKGFPGFEPST